MKLKRLVMKGFKSFADRTEFKFDPYLTAIVGPNGCGKSNIVDAFRWILGEQSVKSLRGREMSDVIFKGTERRKPLPYAEASLHFVDVKDMLNLGNGSDEVIVTRRLYRSGESEYRMDGDLCRLKDIRELFADTGLGKNSYSIIEQGEVTRLISATPTERRQIFDEAAGISLYKERRLTAMRRLERVEQNLARLGDIIGELQRRRRSVKAQATRARTHRALSDNVKQLKLDLALRRYLELHSRLAEVAAKLQEKEQMLQEAETEHNVVAARLSTLDAKALEVGRWLHKLEAKRLQIESESRSLEEQISYNRRRIEENREQKEKYTKDYQQTEESCTNINSLIGQLHSEVQKLQNSELSIEEELKQKRIAGYELVVAKQEVEKQIEQQQRQMFGLLDARSGLRNELSMSRRTIEQLKAKESERQAECCRVEEEIDKGEKNSKKITERRNIVLKQITTAKQEIDSARERRDELARRLKNLEERKNSLLLKITAKRSRFESLEKMQSELAGASEGARQLLKAKQAREPGTEQICGILGELISVEPRHTPALAAALGEEAAAVCVQTTEDAIRLLQRLQKEDRDVRFAILNIVRKPADVNQQEGAPLKKLIRTDARYQQLIAAILKDTYLADDLTKAVELAQRYPECKFVTPVGELVTGSLLIAPKAASASLILYNRSEMLQLGGELKLLERERSEVQQRHSSTESELAGCKRQLDSLLARLTQAQERLNRLETERETAVAELERLQKHRTGLLTELEYIRTSIGEDEEAATQAQERLKHLDIRQAELEQQTTALKEVYKEKEKRVESVKESVTALKVQQAQIQQKCKSAKELISQRETELQEKRESLRKIESEIENAESLCARSAQAIETARTRLAEIAQLAGRTDSYRSSIGQIGDMLAACLKDEKEKESQLARLLSELTGKCNELRLTHSELALKLETVTQSARTELATELPEYAANATASDRTPEEIEQEITSLIEKMGRLGNVNAMAIEELEEVEARLMFLTGQQGDLLRSRKQLLELISALNERSREGFREMFEKIEYEFRQLFRKLFGGGTADILLSEGEDILDAGVEIVARPPGKDHGSLTLLSGGEKAMTTIALLFAMFSVKSSPFCILDEVDAPLDEANLRRFHGLLQELTEPQPGQGSSQFLIITHSKPTMASVNLLYGVTMEEPGVSKKVSVRLRTAKCPEPLAVS